MDPTPDLDIEIEVRQRAGMGYPIRQNRDTAELRGPEGEVAPSHPGSVGKVRRELERLGQPRSRTDRALKRAFDLVGGVVLLIVLAPVLLTISLLIKLDSPGPILFRQRRIGQYGVPFRMFKFRTMVDGADTRKPALLHMNEAAEGLFKINGDPRLTRTGRWLRRTSVDELPQLLDVISGRMSLVGPPTPHPPGGCSDHGSAPRPALDETRDDGHLAGERRIGDPDLGDGEARQGIHRPVVSLVRPEAAAPDGLPRRTPPRLVASSSEAVSATAGRSRLRASLDRPRQGAAGCPPSTAGSASRPRRRGRPRRTSSSPPPAASRA